MCAGKSVAIAIFVCGFFSLKAAAVSFDSVYWAPPLDVQGTKIVNAKGYALQLKGFATMDPTEVTHEQIVRFRNDWHITLLRTPLLVGRCWNVGNIRVNESYLATEDSVIKWCRENQIYVLFDGWHEGGTGNTVGEFSSTVAAWSILADRYKDQDHILWEIFNEPHTVDWAKWVPMAEQLIDTIRAHNPVVKAIVAGTVQWDQVADVNTIKINREKIIYSWHPYKGVYGSIGDSTWEKRFGYIMTSGIAPILNSEWGFDDSKTDSAGYGTMLINYCRKKWISWTGWCYSTNWGPAMLRSLKPEVRNTSGNLMYSACRDTTPFELQTAVKCPASAPSQERTVAIGNSAIRFFCAETSPVTLSFFSLDGRCVKRLVCGNLAKGRHSIPVVGASGGMKPGLYIARLAIENAEYRGPVTLLRR